MNPQMTISAQSFRKAVYLTLALSLFGLLAVCLPILGIEQTMTMAAQASVQIAVGYAAMILVIELIAIRFRTAFGRFRVAAGFAYGLFLLGALAGSATSVIVYDDNNLKGWVMKPMFWLGLYGFLPAMVLGLVGAALLRRINKREELEGRRHARQTDRQDARRE